jgi:lactate permease
LLLLSVLLSWSPVALVTSAFLVLGVLLTATGQAAQLGRAAATLDTSYPALAPWLGGLSGYLTGSNAGANACSPPRRPKPPPDSGCRSSHW